MRIQEAPGQQLERQLRCYPTRRLWHPGYSRRQSGKASPPQPRWGWGCRRGGGLTAGPGRPEALQIWVVGNLSALSPFPLCSASSPLPPLSSITVPDLCHLFSVFLNCLSLPLNHASSSPDLHPSVSKLINCFCCWIKIAVAATRPAARCSPIRQRDDSTGLLEPKARWGWVEWS